MRSLAPCAVRRIELTKAIQALAAEEHENGLLAIFEWEGVPIGQRLFTLDELPLPASAVPTIAATSINIALAAHGTDPLNPDPSSMIAQQLKRGEEIPETISVIVCTRDRAHDLARCLRSLKALDPAPDEVVIVDNSPSDPRTRQLVEEFGSFRYVAEPSPGLSRARNAGVRATGGDLLAFTDDDVEVSQRWCGLLKGEFVRHEVGAVTGLVLPASLQSEAAFAFEYDFGGLNFGFLPREFDSTLLQGSLSEAPAVWNIGAGANMAIRRQVFTSVGLFDERLGAGAAGCSEDSELWHRALLDGWTCCYQPLAAVLHHHRADELAMATQMRSYMRGHTVALFEQYRQSHEVGNLVRAFLELPFYYATSAIRCAMGGPSARRSMLIPEIRGLIEAPLWWLRHKNQPRFPD